MSWMDPIGGPRLMRGASPAPMPGGFSRYSPYAMRSMSRAQPGIMTGSWGTGMRSSMPGMATPSPITGMKGGGGMRGKMTEGLATARSVLMPSGGEMGHLRRGFRGAGGGLSGMWAAGKSYLGVGAGTYGLGSNKGIRRAVGGGMLGAAMLGTSMIGGVSVFDQAQGLVAGHRMSSALAGWAGRGGLARGIGRGAAVAGAAVGGGYLSTGEWALGGMGYGAVRGAQSLIGAAAVAKAPWLSRIGGGRGRAIGAAAGVGLGLLI